MLTEVEKFFAEYKNNTPLTEEEKEQVMTSAFAALQESVKVGETNYQAIRTFERTMNTLGERGARRHKAWMELAQSDDPLIQFLAKNIRENYESHVLELLPILPATLKEIDAFAVNQGWCSDYDGLVRRAQRAGVLPDDFGADISESRKKLMTWFGDNFSRNRATNRDLFEHVDKIVAEALKGATPETDTAEAAA